MGKSLLETFSLLDEGLKQSLAKEESPLKLGLAALEIAVTEAQTDRLTAEHIVACLEAAGVAVRKASISSALARGGGRVSTSKSALTGETQYRIMTKGKTEVQELLGGELMSVVRIEGGRPRTARMTLGEMLSHLAGPINICDPYYGARSLVTLEYIPANCAVRFLTGKTSESTNRLHLTIQDFIKERPQTQIRIANKPNELHDRYVVTRDTLLILGHGLKDIGGKESFIIRLECDLVPDLIDELNSSFEARWILGTSIP